MAGVKDARRALDRGAQDEALVLLWNALEPARIRGDRSALQGIAALALRVEREGDESQANEARRLLDVLREQASEPEHFAAATERVDADIQVGGHDVEPGDVVPEEVEQEPGGRGLGSVVWLVILLLVILYNLLGQLRDGG